MVRKKSDYKLQQMRKDVLDDSGVGIFQFILEKICDRSRMWPIVKTFLCPSQSILTIKQQKFNKKKL